MDDEGDGEYDKNLQEKEATKEDIMARKKEVHTVLFDVIDDVQLVCRLRNWTPP